jgi:hypothetical protein
VLLRLSYLALTGMVTLLRLLPMSSTDKDIEILVLRHQLAVLKRRVDKPRFTPPGRAFLSALLHRLPRPTLRSLHLNHPGFGRDSLLGSVSGRRTRPWSRPGWGTHHRHCQTSNCDFWESLLH